MLRPKHHPNFICQPQHYVIQYGEVSSVCSSNFKHPNNFSFWLLPIAALLYWLRDGHSRIALVSMSEPLKQQLSHFVLARSRVIQPHASSMEGMMCQVNAHSSQNCMVWPCMRQLGVNIVKHE